MARERETVHAFIFEDAWYDIGTPESYLDAVAWHLDGTTVIHPSADVEDATIRNNVHIMAGATISDTTIEDSVVFSESVLQECESRQSIVDKNTEIEGLTLSGAVIGAHTRLNGEF